MLENADDNSGFSEIATNITDNRYDLAVPLYLRPNARYIISSCDSNDVCTDSAELSIMDNLVGSIGYFKASNTDAFDNFGVNVVLSGDGNTLAVGATSEGSNAVGIGGDQANNQASAASAVYVFNRTNTTPSPHPLDTNRLY